MYLESQNQLILPDEFFLPFGGKLNKENRWVKLANMIPWWKAEEEYIQRLGDLSVGQRALSVRVALGALIIKERLGLSDRETVEQDHGEPLPPILYRTSVLSGQGAL